MTLSDFQKGRIEAYIKKFGEPAFKKICEKHSLNMDKLGEEVNVHEIYNMVGELRIELGELQKNAETSSSSATEKKAYPARAYSNNYKTNGSDKSPIKKFDEYLQDLRDCYPDTVMDIKTDIIDRSNLNFVLAKCELLIVFIKLKGISDCPSSRFEAYGYAEKGEAGTKPLIPLAETRAIKKACKLATVGKKVGEGK